MSLPVIITLVIAAKIVLFILSLSVDLYVDVRYMLTASDTTDFVLFALFCPILRILYLNITLLVEIKYGD